MGGGREAGAVADVAPELSFVEEGVTPRRPVGGARVLRRQLEHTLEVTQLPYVKLEVTPTACTSHPGTGGRIQVLKFADGSGAGRMDDDFGDRPVDSPRQLRVLELGYGTVHVRDSKKIEGPRPHPHPHRLG